MHVSQIVKSAKMALSLLKTKIINRDKKVFLKTLQIASLTPHLEYAVTIWTHL